MKNYLLPISLLIFTIMAFFSPFLVTGKFPIPSDTIVGLYHPFRDLYSKSYPRGIPFKNFLITDPVRQQYPWRNLAIEKLRNFELPLWNPYSLSGTPLLANMQSASFYPLNLTFFLFPFKYAWSLNVILQPLLGGIFLYLYLKNLRLNLFACLLSSTAFAFSGFNIAWLEWNTIGHTGLWLPLCLLCIDKIFFEYKDNNNLKLRFKIRSYYLWILIFILALVSSFFAGHLQTFFYLYMVQLIYFILRWWKFRRNIKIFLTYLILNGLFLAFSSIQWMPTLQLLQLSARAIDLEWTKEGWFLPWQNLIQFIVPDFFGNPATLNYWGIWNYGEFIGYVGIFPLMMAIYATFLRHDKKTFFFGFLFILSLFFSLPTLLSKLPYILRFPWISTSQPTRLIYLTDFSLVVLAGLGLDYYMKIKTKMIYIIAFFSLGFITVWVLIFHAGQSVFKVNPEFIAITQRNSYLPTILFVTISFLLVANTYLSKKIFPFIILCLVFITSLELLRFANKFTPFSSNAYLFPTTKTINFLNKNSGYSRVMSTDSRILPPNFSIMYKLYSIDGYDPLYLRKYGELIAASERDKPDIRPPFGFNRIITPKRYNSRLVDLLGVKYILSLSDIDSQGLRKVFQEGEVRIYENSRVFPKVFFVNNLKQTQSNQEVINLLFDSELNLTHTAILDTSEDLPIRESAWSSGDAEIISYGENEVIIRTRNEEDGFLVLMDSYYPSWKVFIDETKQTKIYRINYNFRGVIVPKGNHIVRYSIS